MRKGTARRTFGMCSCLLIDESGEETSILWAVGLNFVVLVGTASASNTDVDCLVTGVQSHPPTMRSSVRHDVAEWLISSTRVLNSVSQRKIERMWAAICPGTASVDAGLYLQTVPASKRPNDLFDIEEGSWQLLPCHLPASALASSTSP